MESAAQTESAIPAKDLFRIGEVSRLTSTKPFVLRYWETEFPMLQPVKSPKGHRLYRREDVDMVFVIKRLLYDEGFTIAGARRHLSDHAAGTNGGNGSKGDAETTPENGVNGEQHSPEHLSQFASRPGLTLNRQTLLDLRDSLRSLLTVLESE